MQYIIVNYGHHDVHYIPLTYFITGSLYLLTPSPCQPKKKKLQNLKVENYLSFSRQN